MRIALAALAIAASAGCASPRAVMLSSACPDGQSQLRTAQVFLAVKPPARVGEADLQRFVDDEVRPRFPDGVTVVRGGGQWTGTEDRLMREARKVVLIALPSRGDPTAEVEAVRTAYKARFRQEAAVVLPPPTCVTL
ncbi:DUF3574 domain-containing protein [Phenylobacterium sp. SCN 70-31]|uniref:DUF3574 domain-containing protein n=1 Tax=Phenylobacterium sp. SCN 70-31 TaxID=1660129 RepID=UPI000868357C|nr:DUF3574 domain-containing protein [Phenylobacterium sp. SCN 70-31]ODT85390.1 MAG: hypothetical protein ABS78_20420 [Phenylobacterium sp. SCN 70-31]